MRDDDILSGSLMEDTWLTLEQVAAACTVEPEWLARHIDDGLFPHVECLAGTWRFSSVSLARARRMWRLERDFDAVRFLLLAGPIANLAAPGIAFVSDSVIVHIELLFLVTRQGSLPHGQQTGFFLFAHTGGEIRPRRQGRQINKH